MTYQIQFKRFLIVFIEKFKNYTTSIKAYSILNYSLKFVYTCNYNNYEPKQLLN